MCSCISSIIIRMCASRSSTSQPLHTQFFVSRVRRLLQWWFLSTEPRPNTDWVLRMVRMGIGRESEYSAVNFHGANLSQELWLSSSRTTAVAWFFASWPQIIQFLVVLVACLYAVRIFIRFSSLSMAKYCVQEKIKWLKLHGRNRGGHHSLISDAHYSARLSPKQYSNCTLDLLFACIFACGSLSLVNIQTHSLLRSRCIHRNCWLSSWSNITLFPKTRTCLPMCPFCWIFLEGVRIWFAESLELAYNL